MLIIKRKARGFFLSDDLETIKKAIKDVNHIISEASILVRAYYCKKFEEAIQKANYDDLSPLEIDDDIIRFATLIIQGKTSHGLRGTNKDNDILKATFSEMLGLFNDLYGEEKTYVNRKEQKKNSNAVEGQEAEVKEEEKEKKLSLSHILGYSRANLLTAYTTNIQEHFEKYPKRYIRCDLLQKGIQKSDAVKLAGKINHLYMSCKDASEVDIPEYIDIEEYEELYPKYQGSKSRYYDLEARPWHYLFKMVSINRALEYGFPDVDAKKRKLLNPLPFHSSFVPKHIRLDTSGLAQLLMTNDRIAEFKKGYDSEFGTNLALIDKVSMLSSFSKIFGREPNRPSEAAEYATELWNYLTNLKTCRQYNQIYTNIKGVDFVFDNAVVTDGVSISFQITEKVTFHRKKFGEHKKKKTKKQTSEEEKDAKKEHTLSIPEEDKELGTDPGKGELASTTDGFRNVSYTSKERRHDLYQHIFTKQTLKQRTKSGVATIESQEMSLTRRNSCVYDHFKAYCMIRNNNRIEFEKLYFKPYFREQKFTKYSRQKYSEQKYVNKLYNTFKDPVPQDLIDKKHCATPEMIQNALKSIQSVKQIWIGWGNWGKNPNALVGSAPTPGIGLRRRIEKKIGGIDVIDERGTSQECPCCHNKTLAKWTINNITRHHLLRCTNDECKSRIWQRNVVGSFNIFQRFLEKPKLRTLFDEARQNEG
jgi:hypothetical protein